jgi:alpha-galactosidase
MGAMRPITRLAACAVLLAGCGATPEPPQSPLLPPMGWNSWNSGIELSERSVEQTIDAMVASGMRDAGYRYVNLDAGWAASTRGDDGRLRADPVRFPHGIAALAAYAHDHGMYLGIYHSPFNRGCGQDPRIAGAAHESVDARTFAAWGVDYLKYDWCWVNGDHDLQVKYFTAMRDALRATGRRIFYSINPNSSGDPTAGTSYDWSHIADMSRDSIDVVPAWGDTALSTLGLSGIAQSVDTAATVTTPSTPTHVNDPDMMVVGLGFDQFASRHPTMSVGPSRPDLTDAEQRAQLSLWAILAAPMLAGNDVRGMSDATRSMLTNRDVIAVDQDPLVVQGHPLPGDPRILVKPMADGSVTVVYVNGSGDDATIGTTAGAIGLDDGRCFLVRDLWSHEESHTTGDVGPVVVPSHGAAMLRVTRCR